MAFGDYQIELYLGALGGVLPAHPFDHAELERKALAALPPELQTYVAGGAGDEATQRANVDAFARYAVVPRMFRAPAERDLSIELFGTTLASPFLLAPVGVVGLCTPDQHGDIHAAEVSAATGVPLIGSTLMSDPLVLARYRLDGVVTLVDAVNGLQQLDTLNEPLKQAAIADRLLLSKTDLAQPEQVAALRERGVGRVEGSELLQRDEPIQVALAREVDRRHAAAPQLAEDLVAADRLHRLGHQPRASPAGASPSRHRPGRSRRSVV